MSARRHLRRRLAGLLLFSMQIGVLPSCCARSGESTPSSGSGSADGAAPLSPAEAVKLLCDDEKAFRVDVFGGRHFAKVAVAGKDGKALEFRFHIDTAGSTPGLTLLRSAATALGFSTAAELPRAVLLSGQVVQLPPGAEWVIAEDAAGGPDLTERRLRNGFSQGQLGAGFLSRYLVCIDPAAGRMGLRIAGSVAIAADGDPGANLGLRALGNNKALYPFVHGLVKDGPAVVGGYGFLLDTGAASSMLETRKIDYLIREHSFSWTQGAAGDADMIGSQFLERMVRAPSVSVVSRASGKAGEIELGSAVFVERPTGTWRGMFGGDKDKLGTVGAIGADVLNRFRILLDYKQGRLWLYAHGQAVAGIAPMHRVGLSIAFGPTGCPEIRAISSSNASSVLSSLLVGDVIVEVDGWATCGRWHHEIQHALGGGSGVRRHIRILRAGEQLSFDVTTKNLLP